VYSVLTLTEDSTSASGLTMTVTPPLGG